MKFETMTVRAVADLVGGDAEGDESVQVASLVPLDEAGTGQLTFAVNDRWAGKLGDTGAGAAIVSRSANVTGLPLIRVDNVLAAVATILEQFGPAEAFPPPGLDASAVVAGDAVVAPDAAVGPGVVVGARTEIGSGAVLCANVTVGDDVRIGDGSVLFEGVVVKTRCEIGRRVRIGPNAVIGHDGFGYYTVDGKHRLIPHAGNVVIEDDVDLGACCCIDRGKFGATRIGAGTKIDNLVQIGHNVQVGRGCFFAGQVGIAGSTTLGDYVVLGGGVGVRDGILIGDGVRCAAHAAIAGSLDAGEIVAGAPAEPARKMLRVWKARMELPDLLKRVKKLEAALEPDEPSEDN